MIFDTERYLQEIEDSQSIKPLKAPNNKVPAVNLPKLGFDKKIASIILDIRFGENFVLRDRFDWDLSDPRLRPIDFATALINHLPFYESDDQKQKAIKKMTNSILDQIQNHIEKNTFFPRVRFCRKEEEIISNEQVCVSCDSYLNNPDYCVHCGFQYDRKPGANVPGDKVNEKPQEPLKKSASMNLQSSIIQPQLSAITSNVEEGQGSFQVPMNKPQLEKSKNIKEKKEDESWRQKVTTGYTYSGKEKKICKKCGEINPFFKNECKVCLYKFPKTRGMNQSLNSDNYSLYFWEILHSDALFSSLNKLNDYLEESDFISVRDLYKKIKEVLSQQNTERIFDITDSQLLELHDFIDETFELLLTDNDMTERIFNDATYIKSGKKKYKQVYLNFNDAQEVYNEKIKELSNDDSFEESQESRLKLKRTRKIAEAADKYKNRPHSFESIKMQTLINNYNLLSSMGFLENKVIQSEAVNKVLVDSVNIVSLSKKRGRPKKFDLTYEDMMNVDKWDESKLVFQNAQTNNPGGQEDEQEGQNANNLLRKGYIDGNADVCGICFIGGKLICCDDCPAAFHAECLGYERQCPRGKWKCYFCKVTKYGVKNVPRMAPNERPICDTLIDNTSTWQEKAQNLLDILYYYQSMRTFFDPIILNEEQKQQLLKNNISVESDKLTIQNIYDKIDQYNSQEEFYQELTSTLSEWMVALDKTDLIHLQAKSTLYLLDYLVDENNIFSFIISQKKKLLPKRKTIKDKSQKEDDDDDDEELKINIDEEANEQLQDNQEEEQQNSQDQDEKEDSDFEVNIDMEQNQIGVRTRKGSMPETNNKQLNESKISNQEKLGKRTVTLPKRQNLIKDTNSNIRMTRNRAKAQDEQEEE